MLALDVKTSVVDATKTSKTDSNQQSGFSLGPVELLLIEKTLLDLYPRLRLNRLPVVDRFLGGLIPLAILHSTPVNTRRIVVIHCGDGVLCNIMALVFPKIEVVGIDPSAEKIAQANKRWAVGPI